MIIDTQKLLDEIEQFEANEISNPETISLSILTQKEKRSLKWRQSIRELHSLANKFNKSIVSKLQED